MNDRQGPKRIGDPPHGRRLARAPRPAARPLLLALLLAAGGSALPAATAEPAAGDGALLELRADRTRVYVHEAVPVTITLLVAGAPLRNIRYPRLDGGAGRVSEFGPPRQKSVVRGGREYVAHEFAATLVPRQPGRIELGPAELGADILAPASGPAAVFGEAEMRTLTLRSAPVALTVLAPPKRGQPADYAGAVGRFTMTREVAPAAVRQGDPVTVGTRIGGVGNFDSLVCPVVALAGVRGYPPAARSGDGRLACEQILIPEAAADIEIPAGRLVYFDPGQERYLAASTPAVRIAVAAAASGTMPPAPGPAGAATDAAAVGKLDMPAPASLSARPPAGGIVPLAGAIVAIVAIVALAAGRRHRRPPASVPQPPAPVRRGFPDFARWLAEAERARAANDPQAFHDAVFRALQGHLGAHYGLPAAGITADIVSRVMAPAGAPPALLDASARLFAACDRVRYGGDAADQNMDETLRLLRSVSRSA